MSPNDLTPAEFAAACFEIQSGGSDEERLRADLRLVAVCDYDKRTDNGDFLLQIFFIKNFQAVAWRLPMLRPAVKGYGLGQKSEHRDSRVERST